MYKARRKELYFVLLWIETYITATDFHLCAESLAYRQQRQTKLLFKLKEPQNVVDIDILGLLPAAIQRRKCTVLKTDQYKHLPMKYRETLQQQLLLLALFSRIRLGAFWLGHRSWKNELQFSLKPLVTVCTTLGAENLTTVHRHSQLGRQAERIRSKNVPRLGFNGHYTTLRNQMHYLRSSRIFCFPSNNEMFC